jgi:peptidoglycan/xylan/chitin deacetylase (PgdA/CDA1 family)
MATPLVGHSATTSKGLSGGSAPAVLPWARAVNYYKRNSARHLFRRRVDLHPSRPLISFTFDDFPRTALWEGGRILKRHGLAGTYYVSLGLLGLDSPSGQICKPEDLTELLDQKHELGCHTFAHCHSWNTKTAEFEQSIVKNKAALRRLFPDTTFQSFSYPLSEPRPLTKGATGRHFLCCRAGGQAFNAGHADLNQLSAFFMEQAQSQLGKVTDLIDRNRMAGGWLILATHDIHQTPSAYGCTPEFFEQVVQYAVNSGAQILPVAEALGTIREPASASAISPLR